jgi:arabinose-5-phosphate isomerase
VEDEGDPLGLVPTTSAIATLAIGDSLMAGVSAVVEVESTTFFRNHPAGSLGKSLSLTFGDVMKPSQRAKACVDRSAKLVDAVVAMSEGRVGACFIVDGSRLLGVFTDGDLRRLIQGGVVLDDQTSLVSVATTDFTFVFDDELVIPAVKTMESAGRKVSVFPVLNRDNEFVGIVHLHDILGIEL